MSAYVIGIGGGTGSGKSTFAQKIQQSFPNSVSIVFCDNYYRDRKDISLEERSKINYDCPDAFENDLMIEQVQQLKLGNPVDCPRYDYVNHCRSSEIMHIDPMEIIVVEGILTLWDERLRNLVDLKVYVDCDADERILRRAIRDTQERGRDLNGIVSQYLNTVKPMHELYVEPTKKYADIIVNGGLNEKALDIVCSKIRHFLQK